MSRNFCYCLILFSFLLSTSLVLVPQSSHAQDDSDPVGQIRAMVESGEKNLATAQKRSIRRKSKQLKYLKKALKSFSDAHRMINGLQLEDPALKEAVENGLNQAHNEARVKKEMKNLAKKLTKALAQKDCPKSYDYIEQLHNLDARSKPYSYLSRVIAKLCPPTSP